MAFNVILVCSTRRSSSEANEPAAREVKLADPQCAVEIGCRGGRPVAQ
jgi:hypothetical protein